MALLPSRKLSVLWVLKEQELELCKLERVAYQQKVLT